MLEFVIFGAYFTASIGLFAYGLNSYVMLWLFSRVREKVQGQALNSIPDEDSLPIITTQIPLFNEANVAERVICAVTAMNYPIEKHEIQILDDSTDETIEIVNLWVEFYSKKGFDIKVYRRFVRSGYKAGALQEGMIRSRGAFIAIFDGDFIPPPHFLRQAIFPFLRDVHLGLVQGRWGHLNDKDSLLTKAQSIGIDGHFVIEQTARTFNGLFMNFNGTAGVWRKSTIYDAGGWEADTLTEDMDLSYRAQLKGWKTKYLPNLVVPAELPHSVSAFKSQQFRWAKGSIQTAKKIFPRVLNAEISVFKKWEAFIHLTHYMIHPLMFSVAFLALPVLLFVDMRFSRGVIALLSVIMSFAVIAPSILYTISQKTIYKNWFSRICYLPVLMAIGVGIAISNTQAVIEAILGFKSEFVRTPKSGDKRIKNYRIKKPWISFLEIIMGVYAFVTLYFYWQVGNFLISPFLILYGTGFLHIGISGIMEILQNFKKYISPRSSPKTKSFGVS